MASATPVTDHDRIRDWVEEHGGRPACVKGTAALLRVDFGKPDAKLQRISWDDWFETFEESNLAALLPPGPRSRFFKLVDRDDAGGRARGGARSGGRSGGKTAGRSRTAAAGASGRTGTTRAARGTGRNASGGASTRAGRKTGVRRTKKAAARKTARKTSARGVAARGGAGRKGATAGRSRATAASRSGRAGSKKR